MSTEQRTMQMRKSALKGLNACATQLLPESIVINDMQYAVRNPVPTLLECREEIAWLEVNGFIVGLTAGLGGERKWRITDLGRTELF